MIQKILNAKKDENKNNLIKLEKEIIHSKNARYMFLYLYYVDSSNIEIISKEILNLESYRYMHFLLRSFQFKNQNMLIDFILLHNKDSRYLYNLLYDLDSLDNLYRLKIINKIILLGNENYIMKAVYYYFIVLNLYDENLFCKIKEWFRKNNQRINKNNYKFILEDYIYRDSSKTDPDGFSPNCFKGRKNHVPNLIVCHTNSTYSSLIHHFYDKQYQVSSHFIIRRDGHIKQAVSLDDSAWANGTSLDDSSDVYYKFASSKIVRSTLDNANYITFSIEHESFDGTLTKKQKEATVVVMRKIIQYVKEKYNYDFLIDREHIIGHNEVNPVVRTKCPGNKFPFEEIIQELKK